MGIKYLGKSRRPLHGGSAGALNISVNHGGRYVAVIYKTQNTEEYG